METTKQFVWGTSGRGESVHVSQLQPGDEVRFSDGFRTVVEVGPGRTSNHTRVRFAGDSATEYGPSDWLAPLAKASEENYPPPPPPTVPIMPRDTVEVQTFSVGQLARRWRVDRARVHALIRAGKLEAFTLPSAGRFGAVLRVPVAAVVTLETAGLPAPRPSARSRGAGPC